MRVVLLEFMHTLQLLLMRVDPEIRHDIAYFERALRTRHHHILEILVAVDDQPLVLEHIAQEDRLVLTRRVRESEHSGLLPIAFLQHVQAHLLAGELVLPDKLLHYIVLHRQTGIPRVPELQHLQNLPQPPLDLQFLVQVLSILVQFQHRLREYLDQSSLIDRKHLQMLVEFLILQYLLDMHTGVRPRDLSLADQSEEDLHADGLDGAGFALAG